MGMFSRISDIVNSNINAILDRAEDPEKIIRLIIQEMEDTLVEVRSSTVKTIAEKKELERKIAAVEHDRDDWQAKAELALTKDREDLAKGALQIKTRLQQELEILNRQMQQVEEGLAKQTEDVRTLQAKLADAKAREQSMVARHQTATNRLKIRGSLYDSRVTDAFARFDQVERSLDHLEGRVDLYDMTKPTSVADELAELETQHQIDSELAALKAKVAAAKSQSGN
ncbi:MAG TPA: phage shock protein PspA [Stellaceae bacterium]|nr:phage shock protein PspA [Stellaceae bacterium]